MVIGLKLRDSKKVGRKSVWLTNSVLVGRFVDSPNTYDILALPGAVAIAYSKVA